MVILHTCVHMVVVIRLCKILEFTFVNISCYNCSKQLPGNLYRSMYCISWVCWFWHTYIHTLSVCSSLHYIEATQHAALTCILAWSPGHSRACCEKLFGGISQGQWYINHEQLFHSSCALWCKGTVYIQSRVIHSWYSGTSLLRTSEIRIDTFLMRTLSMVPAT